MKKLIQHIYQLLEDQKEFALATIITQMGSTPRTAGTQMVIHTDGTIAGTIGGGIAEAAVIENAKDVFNTQTARMYSFDLSQNSIGFMDMICGGKLDVLIEYVAATPENRFIFNALKNVLKKGRQALSITDMGMASEQTRDYSGCRLFIPHGGFQAAVFAGQHHRSRTLHRFVS